MPNRLTDAYVAGLIDGEGCISISGGTHGYGLRLEIGMSAKALKLLRSLKSTHGGSLRRTRKRSARWEEAWCWGLFGRSAARLLAHLVGHLQIKADHARLAVRFQAMIDTLPRRPNGTAGWDDRAKARAKSMQGALQELNRKGPTRELPEGWFARLVGDTWVTPQSDIFADLGLEAFSGTWPRAGMMRNGTAFRRRPLVPRISGTVCSYSPSGDQQPPNLEHGVFWPTPDAGVTTRDNQHCKDRIRPALAKAVRMWPTPRSSDGTHGGQVTPRKSREGGNLIEAVSARMFPTPSETDWKGSSKSGQRRGQLSETVVGGLLNPTWVEWLMGFPAGWTDCEPSATPSCPKLPNGSGGES